MRVDNKRTAFMIITTILWCVATVLAWNNDNYVICLVIGVVIMGIYYILGTANQGYITKGFLFYPIGCWAVIWAAAFILADYFSTAYAGVVPPFKVLGMHPSLACIVFGFWMGGVVTVLPGFVLKKDNWMSHKDWDNFLAKVKEIDDEPEGEVN